MKLKKMLLNNPGLKLLSLLLAILLWLVVANIENPVSTKQFRDVEVKVTNEQVLDSIGKVYEIKSGETATFTVKGRRSALDNLRAKDFNVVADLSHMSEVYSVPVEIYPKNNNLDIEIYRNSNTLCVALEDEATESFPINIVTEGDVAYGYALGQKVVTPNIVEVTGPKSLVRKIDKVSAFINVKHASREVSDKCVLSYFDGDGDELDKTRLHSDSKRAEVTVQVLKTKEISVNVTAKGQPALGYSLESLNYEPQSITIAGTDEVLASIKELTIPDVDITGLSSDYEQSFAVEDYVPEGVVLTEPEQQIMVTAKVGQITTRTITINADQIDIAGGTPKYSYLIDRNTKIKVTLRGFRSKLDSLTAVDFNPMVEVSGYSMGSYVCDIVLAEVEGVSATVDGKVKLRVGKNSN